jgi:hypothetical protein
MRYANHDMWGQRRLKIWLRVKGELTNAFGVVVQSLLI